MSNLLEYIAPHRFIDAEHKFCQNSSTELLLPESEGDLSISRGLSDYDKLATICANNKESFGRAVAAWYLKASGLPFSAIGKLYQISASRAGSIVKTIRSQAYSYKSDQSQWDEIAVRRIEKELHPTTSIGVQGAHKMIQTFIQMRDVEYLMYRHSSSQVALNSGSLRVGRARFQKQREEVGAYRCVCSYCKPARFPEYVELT